MTRKAAEPDTGMPIRPWVLAALGAVIGILIQQLVDLPDSGSDWGRRIVLSIVILLGVGGIAFGLSWQRGREVAAIVAALVCGLVAGGVFLWNGLPDDGYFEPSWQLVCGLVASGFLLVLFQAAQERHPHLPASWSVAGGRAWKREALHYSDVHGAIWTDAILIGASGLFMLATILIAHMLAEMFALVDIDIFHDLLRKNWTNAIMFGGAFAGGLGLLRERAKIISALQHVALLVLRVLAPVLAVGLVGFLAVLPFTGLTPLWATGNTTPLMLSASLVALFLVNAVIGDRGEDAALSRPLRWGAIALGLALLPLVVIAGWSTGLRIGQRGFSPDRLWALTFILLGTITAVAYARAILRRGDWIGQLYRSNLHLAFILGGVALLLSTSLVSFERIATADQIARLESGRIKPVDFDYQGLWFDFGPPGKAAIKRLAARARDGAVRTYAVAIQKQQYRYGVSLNEVERQTGDDLNKRLTIMPTAVSLDAKLRARLIDYDVCGAEGKCELRYVPGQDYAIAIKPQDDDCKTCRPSFSLLYRSRDGDWGSVNEAAERRAVTTVNNARYDTPGERAASEAAAIRAGKVELRTIQRRQLFVDGQPFGDSIPMENVTQP